MINALLRVALRNRLLVLLMAVLLLFYGTWTAMQLPVDVFPDLNRPNVTLMTEAPGLAPEEVETLVTFPLETLLNGLAGVKRIRSSSGIGLSVIYVEFDWGTDIYRARQLVAEKLPLANGRLPQNLTPVMAPISSIMGEILLVSLQGKTTSPMEIRTQADWVVRPRLLAIPGVAQVIPIGGEVRELQVWVATAKMQQYGISLQEVEKALASTSSNTTGGFLESSSQEYLIRHIGQAQTLTDVAQTVVAYRHNIPILLSQMARIQWGPQVKRGDAGFNGKPAVIMSIQKQPGADTLALTQAVKTALAELSQSLSPDIHSEVLFEQANFIRTALANIQEALRDGTILVFVVLMIFLGNMRTTAITLTAIPLSFVATALVFKVMGVSINTMTLGGLAVAIGELVDDAIVDVENIFRRLRENQHLPQPLPPLVVVYRASVEVRNAIVYATFMVVLVFIPLFALEGIEGRLFAPLGLAYITALLASLLVSLTVTPVLSYWLLSRSRLQTHCESWVVRHCKRINTFLLTRVSLRAPRLVMAATGGIVLLALVAIPWMGREFLPPFQEGTATLNVLAMPGTSLTESNRMGSLVEKWLLEVPEVKSVGRRTGRAELDEHAEGVHYSELDIDFKPSKRKHHDVLQDIRSRLTQIPGLVFNIGQPISHRLDHLLSGVRAQIAIKFAGPDLGILRATAEDIRQAIQDIPGVVDLQVEKQVLTPQITIELNRAAASQYGVPIGAVSEWLETALNGRVTGQIRSNQRMLNLSMRLEAVERDHVRSLPHLLIDTPSGRKVPLALLAKIVTTEGPNLIQRENAQRRIVVFCNIAGRDLAGIVQQIQARVQQRVQLPVGYAPPVYGGQFESQQTATRRMGGLSLLCLIGMGVLLYVQFQSWRLVALVLLTIPMALIGAVGAVFMTGGVFSVASLVGFISLTGIAARNSIMKISHYLHLLQEEGESFGVEMILRGSNERLIPVLMTATTAALALIPLALSAGAPGKEILQPMAVVILGGLLSATLLDTLVTPAVFYTFGEKGLPSAQTEMDLGN